MTIEGMKEGGKEVEVVDVFSLPGRIQEDARTTWVSGHLLALVLPFSLSNEQRAKREKTCMNISFNLFKFFFLFFSQN